ncbi:MAG: STAS domain-containing protein [Bacteroidetes bacterium]|nr:STAS domain-containing protein [Bacteroidota bacterium]
MSILVKEHYHAFVIELKGKFLGSIDGSELKDTIDRLKEDDRLHVVIDMQETTFIDSSGIGTLIAAQTSMRKEGGDIRLANMGARVHGVFVVTRLLSSAFASYDSVDEALESFRTDPEPA